MAIHSKLSSVRPLAISHRRQAQSWIAASRSARQHQPHFTRKPCKRLLTSSATLPEKPTSTAAQTTQIQKRVLQNIPLAALLRSLFILSLVALPSKLLTSIVHLSRNNAAFIDRSPILRWLATRTFYDNFCIGTTRNQVTQNMARLHQLGLNGVILAVARESEPQKSPKAVNRDVLNRSNGNGALGPKNAQFKQWVNDYMETIECLGPGDYIAIKCSGGGTQALGFMTEFTKLCRQNSSEEAEKELRAEMSYMKEQLHKICSTAKSKGIRVLLDAEGSLYQSAVDFAALELMATYNKDSRAYVFNTYQMYLRSSMHKLKSHLDYASKNNYIAGAKLVRGAYLHVEADKTMFQPSKAATDAAFDGAVEYLLQPASSDSKSEEQSGDISWTAEVMLATHNSRSVHKALELWSNTGGDKSRTKSLTFGQLMGMADEVSLSVSAEIGRLQPQQQQHSAGKRDQQDFPQLGVYKYTIWGPFKDCFLYMLRRAEENKDAVARSKESVMAILTELKARLLRSG